MINQPTRVKVEVQISFLFYPYLFLLYLLLYIFTLPMGNLGFGAGGSLLYRKKNGANHHCRPVVSFVMLEWSCK